MELFTFVFISIIIVLYIYFHGKYNEWYWKKRGVKFHNKHKLLGLMGAFIAEDKSFFEHLSELYKIYPNEPAVGFGAISDPALYVKDPENVQHILQTDFQAFSDRGFAFSEGDVLADNILFLGGVRWKILRQKMTPLFSTSKLRSMYYIMDKSAKDFVVFLKKNPQKCKGNAYDTINEFCSAAVAGAVFGIGTGSYFDSPLLKMAREAFASTSMYNLKFALGNLSLRLFRLFRIKYFTQYEDFFIGAIKKVIRAREVEGVPKNDFADICVSLQKNGVMRDPNTGYEVEPTDEILAAQAFFFFTAGVDPCAAAMFCTLVELARNPKILEKVVEEIDEVFQKNDNLSYDILRTMDYLEKVLNESFRMYPPIGFLERKCVKDTVLPVGNIKVSKSTNIYLPVYDYQRDPKYYPNPEVFDPERFNEVTNTNTVFYMPFGKGSRICIGARYAKFQVMAGLVHFLRNFTIKAIENKNERMFKKETVQVRLKNVDLEFVPRIN